MCTGRDNRMIEFEGLGFILAMIWFWMTPHLFGETYASWKGTSSFPWGLWAIWLPPLVLLTVLIWIAE